MFIFFSSFFSFFFFFFPPLLSGPYLWNPYSQRLQIECTAWSCCLILHYSLPSNSLRYFYLFFFSAKILSGPYLWNRYSQRLQIDCAAWSCSLILHCCLPSNSLCYFFFFLPRFFFPFFFSPRFFFRIFFYLFIYLCFFSPRFFFFFRHDFVRHRIFHLRGIAPRSHTGRPRTCLVELLNYHFRLYFLITRLFFFYGVSSGMHSLGDIG